MRREGGRMEKSNLMSIWEMKKDNARKQVILYTHLVVQSLFDLFGDLMKSATIFLF